jgi:hypothetical protein
MANDLEGPDYRDDESADIDEVSSQATLFGQLMSVWSSAVGVAYRMWAFFEDEIEFANWQRFGVTIVGGIISGVLLFSVIDIIFRLWTFGDHGITVRLWAFWSQRWIVGNEWLFGVVLFVGNIIQDIVLVLLLDGPFVLLAIYLSHRSAKRRGLQANIVQHGQVIAVVYLFRFVVLSVILVFLPLASSFGPQGLGLAGGIRSISLALSNSGDPGNYSYFPFPLWDFNPWLERAGYVSLLAGVGVLVYSYSLLAHGMKTLYGDHQKEDIRSLTRIIFWTMDGLRFGVIIVFMLPALAVLGRSLILW